MTNLSPLREKRKTAEEFLKSKQCMYTPDYSTLYYTRFAENNKAYSARNSREKILAASRCNRLYAHEFLARLSRTSVICLILKSKTMTTIWLSKRHIAHHVWKVFIAVRYACVLLYLRRRRYNLSSDVAIETDPIVTLSSQRQNSLMIVYETYSCTCQTCPVFSTTQKHRMKNYFLVS